MKFLRSTLLATGLLAATVGSSLAVDLGEKIQIHGFGSWKYARTVSAKPAFAPIPPLYLDGKNQPFLGGTQDGRWDNVEASLNVSATPVEELLITVQPTWEVLKDGSIGTDLDYAFAEWAFSDLLKIRLGRVKQPFGLYNETSRVGTLRPFLSLPQSIYGPVGLVSEGYDGGGLTGTYQMEGWTIRYDLYGGQLATDIETVPAVPTYHVRLLNMVGGRIGVGTPIEGFSFGVSGYEAPEAETVITITSPTLVTLTSPSKADRAAVGAHLEYMTDALWARSEYVHFSFEDLLKAEAVYGELAYKIYKGLQVAGRIDWTKTFDLAAYLKAATPSTLQKHTAYTAGLNYWFSPNFVIKTGYHYVRGNRFSSPDTLVLDFVNPYATLYPGAPALDDTNHLFEAGAQFSF